ncbi:uncharacterized protein PgNI_02141 [Pyricularia grisea]|uniref:Uncharacterized protein n=1 Tax=Pyricularia grisea TaxID=148305 RepID=A0A6P8BF28_PYRGI|nr:uncharacterized protein PgNI_02141 [Pyricularia grisea]TLD15421.1 hypothetical protein PgNI_02141 [Pyricularia grisea]
MAAMAAEARWFSSDVSGVPQTSLEPISSDLKDCASLFAGLPHAD